MLDSDRWRYRVALGPLALIAGLLPLVIDGPRAADLRPYTNVVLAIGDGPFCHGLLIDKVVLTAAHCLHRRPKFNILFTAQGALNRVEVSEQAFTFPTGRGGDSIDTDLAAIRIEQAINPNADGIANLDESPAGRRFGHAENAYLEQGYGPFQGKAGDLLIQRRILNLMYMSESQTHRKFALRVPTPESRNMAIDEDGMLVLAPSDKSTVPEYKLVCQGDSGSAVMAEINGAKYLVGFASRGDFTFQTETRLCGKNVWVSRLDNGGMTWIKGLLGKSF
ncbi:trypsin-like serine protease [Methylobacterium radiotolerans]|uniref:trypsin-like serine protease n=1 Tax=Methylobacterium radiotolerans TaxID=31998 RepID=UPI0009788BF5|nr:trypsin-like serine protease [Methylobacterium radiotolerans]